MKEIKWNADKDRFTQRQAEQIAFGAIVLLIKRMENVEARAFCGTTEQCAAARKQREDDENALAALISEVPARPSLAIPTGLNYIERIKKMLVQERRAIARKAEAAVRRERLKPTGPFAKEAMKKSPDLQEYAWVVMRRTRRNLPMHLPRQFS